MRYSMHSRIPDPEQLYELTYEDRATWGTCTVCGAKHGEWCNADVGVRLSKTLRTGEGVHLVRLHDAPKHYRIVGVSQ